jgi:DNA repair protein RadC
MARAGSTPGPTRAPRWGPADVALIARLLNGPRASRLERGFRLLEAAESLWRLRRFGEERLRLNGLSPVEARRLMAALALGAGSVLPPRPVARLRGPSDSYAFVASYFVGCVRERFVAVALDIKQRPLAVTIVAEGSSDACPIDPREVFRAAVTEGASAILLAHNHPSGDATPSGEDLVLTERLAAAGEILALPVLDHLVIARSVEAPEAGDYVSLVASGLWCGRRDAGWRRAPNPHVAEAPPPDGGPAATRPGAR